MRNAAINAIKEMAKKDRNILFLSGDLGFGVLDDFRKEMPEQYFNVGICEQSMASMAAGLALEGKSVYTYSIGNFPTLRCIEQIRNDICYHNCHVTIMAVGGGFAYGSLGMSHHATEDIAMMRSLPNMKVFTPADAIESEAVVYAAARSEGPCYIRLDKGGEEKIHQSPDALKEYEAGKAIRLKEGETVCLMSAGAITIEAVKAEAELRKRGILAGVYSFPSVKPIDTEMILHCAEKYEIILTIEEHNVTAGFGSAVAEVIAESTAKARLTRIGLQDVYSGIVGSQTYLRHVYGMDSEAIVSRVESMVQSK